MDPVTLMALLAPLIQGGVSAAGAGAAAGQNAEGRKILEAALARFRDIPLPQLEKMLAETVGSSAEGGVSADPQLAAAQRNVLAKIQQIEDKGGMTLEDQALLNRSMGAAARQESAGRAQIRNQMQARGVANSGADLAMQLQNQQGAAERANQSGLDVAAQAQRRAYDALLARGRMAGGMRDQDFGERSRAAQARDSLARFNAGAQERAQQYNLNLPQRGFENQMRLTGASAGMENSLAGMHANDARNTQNMFAGFGAAAAEGMRTPYDMKRQQESDEQWKKLLASRDE